MVSRWRECGAFFSVTLLCSCIWAADGGVFFSSSELRDAHPAIRQVMTYWDKNNLRTQLPVKQGDDLRGFVLEYGNSGFPDYHSMIGLDTVDGSRAFVNKEEALLTKENKDDLGKIFQRIGRYKESNSGKNINPYTFDGNVYLLSLISQGNVVKIPYYAPKLEEYDAVQEISLLNDVLLLDGALKAKPKKK